MATDYKAISPDVSDMMFEFYTFEEDNDIIIRYSGGSSGQVMWYDKHKKDRGWMGTPFQTYEVNYNRDALAIVNEWLDSL